MNSLNLIAFEVFHKLNRHVFVGTLGIDGPSFAAAVARPMDTICCHCRDLVNRVVLREICWCLCINGIRYPGPGVQHGGFPLKGDLPACVLINAVDPVKKDTGFGQFVEKRERIDDRLGIPAYFRIGQVVKGVYVSAVLGDQWQHKVRPDVARLIAPGQWREASSLDLGSHRDQLIPGIRWLQAKL